MLKKIFVGLFSSHLAFASGDARAAKIARESGRARALLAKLKAEVGKTSPAESRKEALAFLGTPEFRVLAGRKGSEAEILAKLKEEKLVDEKATALFPSHAAMPFIAAPGSPCEGHHGWPGGLLLHTLTNLELGVSYARVYRELEHVRLDENLIRLAAVWHDAAKTFTIEWGDDGVCTPKEETIAGTSAHHVWGVAEALYRGYPGRFAVTLASAHNPPLPGGGLSQLVDYLRAGAIIAGKPFAAAGLTPDGKALASPPPIEAFVNHLDDHDFVLTVHTIKSVRKPLDEELEKAGVPEKELSWERMRRLANEGDKLLYQKLAR